MKEIKIHLWDDVHWHEEEERVESEETHYLELDGRRVRLDVTGAHGKELAAHLKRWLDAGHPEDEEPSTRLGFKPGSSESKRWHADLRAWADSVDRSEEYIRHHRDGSVAENDYKYPRRLVRDYEAYLRAQATAA